MASMDHDFPTLRSSVWQQTSSRDPKYNCIAFAAGRTDRYWWPDNFPDAKSDYWPAGIPREETIDAFVQLYQSFGYEPCDNSDLEAGFEKIAIYALNGEPTHAARQLPSGHWSSKLGPEEDINHATLESLNGPCYGEPVRFMRRKVP